MAYEIKKTDGTVLTTIADGTRDTTTSLSLAGPNYVGYGQQLDQNLVYLLENFAGNGAPSSVNLQGQLWFDKYNQVLKVFTEQGYVAVSGVTNSSSQPAQGKNGDIWYNTSTEQMYVYDTSGTEGFKIVGPSYTKEQGISGAVPATVEDGSISGIFHKILKLQFGNLTYATISTDTAFLPTPPLPGFTMINPGITFSSNVLGPTINANVTGVLTGSVIGSVTGNVVATTLSGNLTGSVIGSVTGNVVATTLSGNLTGNVSAVNITTTNLSSSNIAVTGGSATGLLNVTASAATITALSSTTASATNFSSSNILVTGGNVSGLTRFGGTTGQATNFSSSNILVTGGSLTGLTAFGATTGQATNFSSSNILVAGGNVSGLTTLSTTTGQATNFSSSNILVTGGNVSGLTRFSGTTGQATNFSSSNILVTGGSASNTTGSNVTLSSSTLQDSTATTKTASDNTTAIATTAFVHSVLPTGIIVMWNSTAVSIPAGWQLCDGSNSTPDLRGQFIIGAGGSYNPAATGGASTVTLNSTQMPVHTHAQSGVITTGTAGAHTHGVTVTDPGHVHTGVASPNGANINWVGTGGASLLVNAQTNTNTTGIGVALSSAADHTHSVTLSGNTATAGGTAGTTQPHENLPPYYALCYIQKMY